MSKSTVPNFWKPAVWVMAIVAIAAVIAAGAGKFSNLRAHEMARAASATAQPAAVNAEQRRQIRATLAALPLAFEENQGQADPQVKYTARGNGYAAFLTENTTVFVLTSARPSDTISSHGKSRPNTDQSTKTAAIDMRLLGANQNPSISTGTELAGTTNYYIGSNPKNWRTGVQQYSSVAYRDVYPGVNMLFHGEQRQLEFDFVVAPGADAKSIGMGFEGADKLATDASGNLVLTSAAGDVVLHKPIAYQEKDGKHENVEVAFQVKNHQHVGLQLGSYDRSRELVIDPSLSYATYLGGTAEDDAYAVAIDGSGNAYITGQTKSTDFPTVSGAYSASNKGAFDIFVTKLAANGSSLVYSTYIGGTGNDSGTAIALDGSGNAYVAGGTTTSSGFPTTAGAFQTTFGGGSVDAFVLELASNGGSLTFSTLLGGNGDDVANGIALDTSGVYVVGSTASTNFPTSSSPYQGALNGTSNGFVTKLNTSGSALAYSTYLGKGTGDVATAVAVDSSGNAYVTGSTSTSTFPTTTGAFQTTCGTGSNCNGGLSDAFVTKFNSTGASLVYSTFLGGEAADQGLGIALDGSGNAYITGLTQSSLHFPVKSPLQAFGGVQDAFVTELNSTGTGLVYSTYLGGSSDDAGNSIAVDGNNNAYVTGQTNSTNFPTAAATQSSPGGNLDAFVSEISASGSSLVFSTYLGGSQNEDVNASGGTLSPLGAIAVDSSGTNIYVVGNTASTNFPGTTGFFQPANAGGTDAFAVKFSTGSSSGSFTVTNGALSNTSGHAGVSANATITVTSTGGFNSAVQLACSVSPAVTKGPTCSFSNPAGGLVTPPANSTATATLNVVTTTSSAAMMRPEDDSRGGMVYALLLPVFGLTLVGAVIQPTGVRRKKLLGLVFLGMVLTSALVLPACGGGNSGGGGGGTPTGTYTITVTGTNGSTTVTGTPALTLTVN